MKLGGGGWAGRDCMEVSEVEVIEDMDVSDLNEASDLEIQYRSTP